MGVAPTSRTIFRSLAVFLGVFALHVDREPEGRAAGDAHQQIERVEAGGGGLKGQHKAVHDVQQLLRSVRSRRQPPCLAQLCGVEPQNEVGDVGNDQLLDIDLFHRSNTFFRTRSALSTTVSLNASSRFITEGREAFLTF